MEELGSDKEFSSNLVVSSLSSGSNIAIVDICWHDGAGMDGAGASMAGAISAERRLVTGQLRDDDDRMAHLHLYTTDANLAVLLIARNDRDAGISGAGSLASGQRLVDREPTQ